MTGDNHRFEENLKQMLDSAFARPRPGFQDRLVKEVLTEVQRQRRLQAKPTWWQAFLSLKPRPLAYAAAATILLVAALLGLWLRSDLSNRAVAQVSCLYGLVAVQANGNAQAVSAPVELRPGELVKTKTGSKAQILLPDNSRLVPGPRTTLKIARTRQGPQIVLEKGTLNLEAAKQAPGRCITIESSHAQVKVLGTKLQVRLVEKPTGVRQTRVRVLSGRVEMASGGKTVLLLPGTEGVADEGQTPVRASLVPEVNDLLHLVSETDALARRTGRNLGLPAILDFTTDTVWSLVPTEALKPAGQGTFTLRLKYPAFRARAYTLDGAEIPAIGTGAVLTFDVSSLVNALTPGQAQLPPCIILKVPGVGGLLKTTGEDLYECQLPATATGQTALLQMLLPASAQVRNASPTVVETATEGNKLIVTVAASVRLPQLYE